MQSSSTFLAIARRAAAASLCFAALQQAQVAHADPTCLTRPTGNGLLDPECVKDVGPPVCMVGPNHVPGLSGLPVWPANTTAPDPTGTIRPEVSEPRWSSFPLRGLFSIRPNGDAAPTDDAHYRIVLDDPSNPKVAAVSIQLTAAANTPTSSDFVYFGIANVAGTVAWGVEIPLTAAASAGAHVPILLEQTTAFMLGQNGVAGWDQTPGVPPNWMSAASMWKFTSNSQGDADAAGLHGAKLAIQFKIDLTQFNLQAGETPRVMMGIEADFGTDMRIRYFTPNLARCTGGACTMAMGRQPRGFVPYPFLADPKLWTPIAAIGSTCQGISIARQDISTPLRCGKNNSRTNCVSALATRSNTFYARPDVPAEWEPAAKVLNPGELEVTFKMSNWGAVADPAQWVPLGKSSNTEPESNDLETYPVTMTCGPNATAGVICEKPITVDYTNENFHQCLLAELSTPAPTTDKVTFSNGAAYINTRFEPASTIDVPAQINIKGLPDLVPGQTTRDVYLLVSATNMRAAGTTTTTIDVPALEALRGQADSGFHNSAVSCDGPNDRCFSDGEGGGFCRTPAQTNDGYYCLTQGSPQSYGTDSMWCVPQVPRSCVPPAGGGVDKDTTALSAGEQLVARFPTYQVFPFYDTGAKVTVNGQSRKSLAPMPSFGIHATHTGAFYGWSRTLLDSAGNTLPEVYPNVFKLTISKASGIANIRVRVTAEELQPAYFYQIAGNATPLSLGLGSATITGLTRTPTFNLSKSVVVMQKLLDNGGRELVSNFKGPITMTRLPGATRNLATFAKVGSPTITMQVANLPLLGQTVSIQVTGGSINVPTSCGSGFGTASITTAFTIGDGTKTPVLAQGTDAWTCVPLQLLNF